MLARAHRLDKPEPTTRTGQSPPPNWPEPAARTGPSKAKISSLHARARQHSAMSNMHIHQAMLSPVAMDGSKVGTNILARQPDVEVAAMLLRPLPLTTGKFAELAGGKDFMSMQFVVLEVGGPGFSSVPYGKKGEKAANQLPLYTRTTEGGHTLFHTFKKVESNLERSPRSSTEEGANGPVDLACTLAPGLSLSMFIRPDNFKGNVFFNGRLEGGDRSKPSELQYVKLSKGSPY